MNETDETPAVIESRDGTDIGRANLLLRAYARDHAGHGVDYVDLAVTDGTAVQCYCGARLTFSDEQHARLATLPTKIR